VEIELDQLDLGRLRRHWVDLRILVRWNLEFVDGNRDVLPRGRQHEIHSFFRALGIRSSLDDGRGNDFVAGAFTWRDSLDRVPLDRLRDRVVQEGDPDRGLALARGAD